MINDVSHPPVSDVMLSWLVGWLVVVVVVVVVGRSWQAMIVLQHVGLLYRPLWTFQLLATR
jgi:hypothetical protein